MTEPTDSPAVHCGSQHAPMTLLSLIESVCAARFPTTLCPPTNRPTIVAMLDEAIDLYPHHVLELFEFELVARPTSSQSTKR
jgi:hypothetical protein